MEFANRNRDRTPVSVGKFHYHIPTALHHTNGKKAVW